MYILCGNFFGFSTCTAGFQFKCDNYIIRLFNFVIRNRMTKLKIVCHT